MMKVRVARPEDDDKIITLQSRASLPGPFQVATQYEGSFFKALELQGSSPKVLVGEVDGEIVGAGAVTLRKAYLTGVPNTIAYLSSLMLAPKARGSSLLARGYQLFREIQAEGISTPCCITAIMRNNTYAIDLLTSGRGGLPQYRFVGGYKTSVLGAFKTYVPDKDFLIIPGNQAGPEVILQCLERYGQCKDLFPVLGQWGEARTLSPEDFLVAFHGSAPVGVVALWDQQSLRRLVVEKYPRSLRLASIMGKFVGMITGDSLLPTEGQPFAPTYLSSIAVKDNDCRIFHALVKAALTRTKRQGRPLLIAGLFEEDPLQDAIKSFLHLSMYSNIYAVSWDRSDKTILNSDRIKYLDVGSL